MTLQAVLAGLTFYNGSNFSVYPNTAWAPFTTEISDKITQAIVELYDFSPYARAFLDTLAGKGPIKFMFQPGNTGQFVPETLNADGSVATAAFIRIDPAATVSAINKQGQVYDLPFVVNLGHEIAHYATGALDSFDPATDAPESFDLRNEEWNKVSHKWDGDNLKHENAIVHELIDANRIASDPLPIRAGYQSGVGSAQITEMGLVRGISYTNGNQIDYVRYGDVEYSSKSDDILMSDNSKSFLIFGLKEVDTIKVGLATSASGHNFVYGGAGADRLGSEGSNYLYGEVGDDILIAKGPHKSYLFGGEDNDKIYADNAEVSLGTGTDQVWVSLGGNVIIKDGDADDVLYLDGHKITGGQGRLIDFEKIPEGQAMGMDYFINWGIFDDNGVFFEQVNNNLEIMLPDTKVTIENWVEGKFGIFLDQSNQSISIYDDNYSEPYYFVDGPDTPFSKDGNWNYSFDLMYYLHQSYSPGTVNFPDMFI